MISQIDTMNYTCNLRHPKSKDISHTNTPSKILNSASIYLMLSYCNIIDMLEINMWILFHNIDFISFVGWEYMVQINVLLAKNPMPQNAVEFCKSPFNKRCFLFVFTTPLTNWVLLTWQMVASSSLLIFPIMLLYMHIWPYRTSSQWKLFSISHQYSKVKCIQLLDFEKTWIQSYPWTHAHGLSLSLQGAKSQSCLTWYNT